jgi:hypothetical protein
MLRRIFELELELFNGNFIICILAALLVLKFSGLFFILKSFIPELRNTDEDFRKYEQ